jgi:hypothetical protein
MAHLSYLGGLKREFHYIKTNGEDGGYEPTLVIFKPAKANMTFDPQRPGKSFMIPLESLWKYIDSYPKDDPARDADREDFQQIADRAQSVINGRGHIVCYRPSPKEKQRAIAEIAACQFAWAFNKGTGILLCTAFNLAIIMQMFDISPLPQAAAQLLMWIQDCLDELKNMPENPEKDEKFCAGEATVFVDGQKIASKDMEFTETEVIMQEQGVN